MSEDDWDAVNESDLEQDNVIDDPETPAEWEVSAAPILSGLIRTSPRSQKKAEKWTVTVGGMETRWNTGNKKK